MHTQKGLRLQPDFKPEANCRSTIPTLRPAFNRFGEAFETGHTPTEELLAQVLIRNARAILRDLTQCPPDTIPAHIQRLDDHVELMWFAVTHGHLAPAQSRLFGSLGCPSTVADFVEALRIARKQHRSPSLIEGPDAERLQRIETKVESIASYLSQIAGGAL